MGVKRSRFVLLWYAALLVLVPGVLLAVRSPAAPPSDGRAAQKAPELAGRREDWVNGRPSTLAAQKGRVVLLTFWTHQCINCKRTLPYWNDWAKRYQGTDVVVVSVHTPETASERVPANVHRAVRDHGVAFPVLIDNEAKNWDAYGVRAWPTTLLIDKQGRIRGRWEGELNWENSGEFKRVEQAIEGLRKERP